MRRTLAALLSALAATLPLASGVASAAASNSASTTTRKLTGIDAQAGQWGNVQTIVTVKTTISGTHKTLRYTDLGGSYSYHTSRSQFIMTQALPLLRQEFLAKQSANIQMISGATLTSEAFIQSLQSALLKTK
jgi:uncharacterized protein with FMN-binding domain